MRRTGLPIVALAAVVFLTGQGCEQETLVVDNVGEAGADADARPTVDAADGDVGTDTTLDVDADRPSRSGPLTFVVDERALLDERLCDHDGDGVPDNAMAELGASSSAILASVMTSGAQSAVNAGLRALLHFTWVDDLAGPTDDDTVIIMFDGMDTVDRHEIDDDFSGEEPFFVNPRDVDGCGEPLDIFLDVALEANAEGGGAFEKHVGAYSFPLNEAQQTETQSGLHLGDATVWGRLEPWGRGGELTICGYFLARDLGAIQGDVDFGSLSWLETLLAGGSAFGVPTLQGISPDIDLDGDGIEMFELDADSRVTRCIDGDSTPIEGPDCWQDERIADAFAFVARLHLVPAILSGLEPGWENHPANPDDCEAPPESSLWDPS